MPQKVRQVLRDPEHADFLVGELEEWIKYIIKDSQENGTQERDRPRVRRLRLIQKSVTYNAHSTRARAGEEMADEF